MFPLVGGRPLGTGTHQSGGTRANARRTSSDREHRGAAGRSRGCPRPPDQRGGGGGGWPGRQRGRAHWPRAGTPRSSWPSGNSPSPTACSRACRASSFLMQCTVGYDRIDVGAATHHGVLVANSPRFCIEEVSDHAVHAPHGLRPATTAPDRRVPPPRLEPAAGRRGDGPRAAACASKTLGFVGFGKIARLTAEKMAGFGMRYLAHDPYLSPEAVRPWRVELASLDELCRQLRLHLDARPPERGHPGDVRGRPFGAMKPTPTSSTPPAAGRGRDRDDARPPGGPIAGAALDVAGGRSRPIRTTRS